MKQEMQEKKPKKITPKAVKVKKKTSSEVPEEHREEIVTSEKTLEQIRREEIRKRAKEIKKQITIQEEQAKNIPSAPEQEVWESILTSRERLNILNAPGVSDEKTEQTEKPERRRKKKPVPVEEVSEEPKQEETVPEEAPLKKKKKKSVPVEEVEPKQEESVLKEASLKKKKKKPVPVEEAEPRQEESAPEEAPLKKKKKKPVPVEEAEPKQEELAPEETPRKKKKKKSVPVEEVEPKQEEQAETESDDSDEDEKKSGFFKKIANFFEKMLFEEDEEEDEESNEEDSEDEADKEAEDVQPPEEITEVHLDAHAIKEEAKKLDLDFVPTTTLEAVPSVRKKTTAPKKKSK